MAQVSDCRPLSLKTTPKRNEPEFKSAMISTLRWILVLPAAHLVAFFARTLFSFFSGSPYSPGNVSWVVVAPLALTFGVTSYCSTLAAVFVAPFWRKGVAIAMTALCGVVATITIVLCFNGYAIIHGSRPWFQSPH